MKLIDLEEEKILQKKVQLGKVSKLIQQNQTTNALNNPAIAKNIAEGLKAEKDLKYINRVLPLREKATPTGFIKSLWSETAPEIAGGIKATPSALKGFIKSTPGTIGGLVKSAPGAIATGVKGIAKGFWDISKPATAFFSSFLAKMIKGIISFRTGQPLIIVIIKKISALVYSVTTL